MFDHSRVNHAEPQDGLDKTYNELIEMATKDYWVEPINEDGSTEFGQDFHVSEIALSGKVHYTRR